MICITITVVSKYCINLVKRHLFCQKH